MKTLEWQLIHRLGDGKGRCVQFHPQWEVRFRTKLESPHYYKSELIEGNGYEGRQTSKVLNNRRSYNLKVPITWSRRCTAENKMAEDSEEMFG